LPAVHVLAVISAGFQGLLAGRDDLQLVKETGSIREINRHHYSLEEAQQSAQRPVVQVLWQSTAR
jgi:sucrose phosphorylase